MKKKKNAFTLIELLAIIVILAIIAVITVPIILNIIENSKKGAATDSAYGYKFAIHTAYAEKLSTNKNIILSGTYEVESNGSLSGNFSDLEVTNLPITLSGTVPTSGKLRYSNNELNAGCIVIGDYKVTFNSDGKVNETVKGDCSNFQFPPEVVDNQNDVDEQDDPGTGNVSESTIASCPGCRFIYSMSALTIESDNMPPLSETTYDYREIVEDEENYPIFLGLIESENNEGKIGKAFACGIYQNPTTNQEIPFCLEGYNVSKWTGGANADVLNEIYKTCNADKTNNEAYCTESGVSISAYARNDGLVSVSNADTMCVVDNEGNMSCGY